MLHSVTKLSQLTQNSAIMTALGPQVWPFTSSKGLKFVSWVSRPKYSSLSPVVAEQEKQGKKGGLWLPELRPEEPCPDVAVLLKDEAGCCDWLSC